MLSLGIAGDAADVIARCRAAARRWGREHLSFGPPLGPDPVAAIGLLGEQVLPALRALPERSRAARRPRRPGAGERLRTPLPRARDMVLHDLRVTVESIGGRPVCGLRRRATTSR